MKTALELLRLPINPGDTFDGEELELVAERAREEMQAECIEWCKAFRTDDGTAQKIEAHIRALPTKGDAK